MSNALETLEDYWAAAAEPRPLVVFGAGRWGRVWASVAAGARGTGEGIALIARSNLDDTRAWQAEHPSRAEIVVTGDPESVLRDMGEGGNALIASRPKDHIRDVDLCLRAGVPALVEKPFSDDPAESARMVERAAAAGLVFGIGVEFSLLPELHALGEMLGSWAGTATLHWEDPDAEVRHGHLKRPHDEISLLDDILPHALSIFGVIAGSQPDWVMQKAFERGVRSAQLSLQDRKRAFRLFASKAMPERTRRLEIECQDGRNFVLDFAKTPARLTSGGRSVALDPRFGALSSTLRLELGAWFRALDGGQPAIVADLKTHIAMHARLRELLA